MAECYFCFLRNISDECFDRGKHKEERAAERENKLVLQEIDKQREQQETSILYECAESFSQEQEGDETDREKFTRTFSQKLIDVGPHPYQGRCFKWVSNKT